jgi:hypothetical protein
MSKPDFADAAAAEIAGSAIYDYGVTFADDEVLDEVRQYWAAIIRRHAVEKPEPRDYNERTGEWE